MTDNLKILAIETSGRICGVSVSEGSKILCSYSNYMNNMHDQVLAKATKNLLEDTGLKLNDVDVVAISAGPGSFTGLRIGGAFVKALCFGGKPELLPVSSLEVLAFNALPDAVSHKKEEICAVIQAHQKLIYTQSFDLKLKQLTGAEIISIEDMIYSQKVFYIGQGIKSEFQNNLLNAEMVAVYASEFYSKDRIVDSNEFIPNYIQDFVPKNTKKNLNI